MKNFAYVRAHTIDEAIESLGSERSTAAIKAGGTDLMGEMKNYIFSPAKVINVNSIRDLNFITQKDNAITIGATTTLTAVAGDKKIREELPALAEAAEAVASPQIRNMATIGGNNCQRPRCWYYRDPGVPCIKKGGDECFAFDGRNKYHAILSNGPCYMVHPSDTAVAFMAYDAVYTVRNKDGSRETAASDFFVKPDDDPLRENILEPGDILTSITVPVPDDGAKSSFTKVREREVWDFAVASVAVNLTVQGGNCANARIILGAAAPVPLRSEEAENALTGRVITPDTADAAARAAVADSAPLNENGYKVDLFINIIKQAVLDLV